MLPAAARLRRSEDFRVVLRRGSKAGRRRLVVHALTTDPSEAADATRYGLCPGAPGYRLPGRHSLQPG